MKIEDIDWDIYHILVYNQPITISELITKSKYTHDVVNESILRLKKYGLIKIIDDTVTPLDISEILIQNQINQDKDMSVYIENGIIKVKK
ncbi:MAG TPA: hypothetical protein O0X99_01695 [Methanocorpusculum sp.]|nr:hypothetical protein [Methanocorpusculum sp.]